MSATVWFQVRRRFVVGLVAEEGAVVVIEQAVRDGGVCLEGQQGGAGSVLVVDEGWE